MEKYKPSYLGKTIPVDNPSKLTDFVTNKYDAFSKVYDACKEQSSNISDLITVDNPDPVSLSIKLSTDKNTLDTISELIKEDDTINIHNDVITARS